MNVRKKKSNVQGKFPAIQRSKKYTQSLGVLFSDGAKMAGTNPLQIARVLRRNAIDAVFVGGLVVGCHTGRPRTTQDVDVIVSEEKISLKLLKELGDVVKAKRVEKHPSFLSFIVSSVVGDREVLDVITSKAGSYRLVFDNCEEISIGSSRVKIPTAEMLIVLKYTAALNPVRSKSKQLQDWSDIYAILDANPSINQELIQMLANQVVPGFGDDLRAKIKKHVK
jgi:hypothetical protein